MNLERINRAFRNPLKTLGYVSVVLKGYYYKIKYSVLRKNVRIGRNFKVKHTLSIRGPGRITIGDNVYIDGTSNPVTPWTSSREAEISIGNNVFLNGTRFSCAKKIEIGDNCIIADCRILDTDFHSIHPTRRNDPTLVKSAPILIGKNVWIALGCVILRGVRIGDNSTVSAQSVVYGDVPEGCVYGGNPATLIKIISLDSE
jgi:acetyltransferase-like isoleucine patch superfamily enzyme